MRRLQRGSVFTQAIEGLLEATAVPQSLRAQQRIPGCYRRLRTTCGGSRPWVSLVRYGSCQVGKPRAQPFQVLSTRSLLHGTCGIP